MVWVEGRWLENRRLIVRTFTTKVIHNQGDTALESCLQNGRLIRTQEDTSWHQGSERSARWATTDRHCDSGSSRGVGFVNFLEHNENTLIL